MSTIDINNSEETIILDVEHMFVDESLTNKSPIDRFYDVCTEYVKLTKPELLNSHPDIARLLLMGYVSAVEEYFRNLFCEIIRVCPISREKASTHKIDYGSIYYYDLDKIEEGLFDSASFASQKEIINKAGNLLSIEINKGTSVYIALEKFNDVCNLRHCSIHSGGILNGHNAKALGLSKIHVKKKLEPNATALQDILMVCYSLVRAFNQHAFNTIILRWNKNEVLEKSWNKDETKIKDLLRIFLSIKDKGVDYNIRKAYKKLLFIEANEVCPESTTNSRIIKTVLRDFLDSKDNRTITENMTKLLIDESISILDAMYNIDEEGLIDLAETVLQDWNNGKLCMAIILCLVNNGRFEVKEAYNIRLGSTLIEFSKLYSLLHNLSYDQLEEILEKLYIIDDLMEGGFREKLGDHIIDILDNGQGNKLESISYTFNYDLNYDGQEIFFDLDVEGEVEFNTDDDMKQTFLSAKVLLTSTGEFEIVDIQKLD